MNSVGSLLKSITLIVTTSCDTNSVVDRARCTSKPGGYLTHVPVDLENVALTVPGETPNRPVDNVKCGVNKRSHYEAMLPSSTKLDCETVNGPISN